ncbi:hypothetical protein [Flavobacterium sp.]|uniref:hypothetical protein n=1 Tax=Flavobacterium sp. TaxID=239 RepID=UPI003D6A8634
MTQKKKYKNTTPKNESSETKKNFYKRLLYIALCAVPIYLFASEKGTFRLVPLPFFLIGMYQLLILTQSSQFIVDAFFPPKVAYEKTSKPFDRFMYRFASGLFGTGLIALLFEVRKIDNTINGTSLFWTSGLVGIGLAVLLTVLLKRTNPSVYDESRRRYTVHFGLFVGLFLLSAAGGSFINHFFADENENCASYTLLRKGISGSRSKEHFIFLLLQNNNEERFSIDESLYDKSREGGKIELCTIKGQLGFECVTDFNAIEK